MKPTHDKRRPRAYRGDGRPWGRRRWLPAQVQDVAAAARGRAIHYAQFQRSRVVALAAAVLPPSRVWWLAVRIGAALGHLGLYESAARTVYAAAAYQRRISGGSP